MKKGLSRSFSFLLFAFLLFIVSCSYLIKVVQITVTSWENATQIHVGDLILFEAEVLPENASNRSVVWSVSNPALASISQDGYLVGLAAGNAIVTANSQDGSGVSGEWHLEILPKEENPLAPVIDWVSVNGYALPSQGESLSFGGGTADLKISAGITDPQGNECIVSVFLNGDSGVLPFNYDATSCSWIATIDGVTIGEYTFSVFAENSDGLTEAFTFYIKVIQGLVPVNTIEISTGGVTTLTVGSSLLCTADVFPLTAANRSVSWTVYDVDPAVGLRASSRAVIAQDGTLTGTNPGNIRVRGDALDGSGVFDVYDLTVIPVTSAPDICWVSVNGTLVAEGEEIQLPAGTKIISVFTEVKDAQENINTIQIEGDWGTQAMTYDDAFDAYIHHHNTITPGRKALVIHAEDASGLSDYFDFFVSTPPEVSVTGNPSTLFGEENASVTITWSASDTSGLKQLWLNVTDADGALSYEASPIAFNPNPQLNQATRVEFIVEYAFEESDYRPITFEIVAESWYGRLTEPATFIVYQDNIALGMQQTLSWPAIYETPADWVDPQGNYFVATGTSTCEFTGEDATTVNVTVDFGSLMIHSGLRDREITDWQLQNIVETKTKYSFRNIEFFGEEEGTQATMTVEAVDAAGNVSELEIPIWIDTHSPEGELIGYDEREWIDIVTLISPAFVFCVGTDELLLINEYKEGPDYESGTSGTSEGLDCVFFVEIEGNRVDLTTSTEYTYSGYDDFTNRHWYEVASWATDEMIEYFDSYYAEHHGYPQIYYECTVTDRFGNVSTMLGAIGLRIFQGGSPFR